MTAWTQLLVYGFGPEARFEGRMVGVIDRLETGLGLRVLDALFVQKDEAGEVAATTLAGDGSGSIGGQMIAFRLDDAERRKATERALADEASLANQVSAALAPGQTLLAVLVEHRWGQELDDAVERSGGRPMASTFNQATNLSDVSPDVLSAARELR